jgi:hypothetical protein
LPPGVSARDVEALVQKRRRGAALTAAEADMLRPLLGQLFAERGSTSGASGFGGGGGRSAGAAATEYQFGGNYWVIADRGGALLSLQVETGLTDLVNSEIITGLELGDQVMLLPSTSLFEQQVRLQDYISERFSSTPFQQNSGGNGRRDRFFR